MQSKPIDLDEFRATSHCGGRRKQVGMNWQDRGVNELARGEGKGREEKREGGRRRRGILGKKQRRVPERAVKLAVPHMISASSHRGRSPATSRPFGPVSARLPPCTRPNPSHNHLMLHGLGSVWAGICASRDSNAPQPNSDSPGFPP